MNIYSPYDTVGGEVLQKKDQSLSSSYSSWQDFNSLRIRGVLGTRGTWDDYYQMYVSHSTVRAAIDKVAKICTNSGWYYDTRDAAKKPNEAELATLNAFFDSQLNLMKHFRKAYKHLMICGNAYIYIVSDRRRKPVRLKTLHPKTMRAEIDKHGEVVQYVQTVYSGPSGRDKTEVKFKPSEIIHIMIEDPDSDTSGISMLESLRHAVSSDLYAQQYNRLFFQNSGVTGVIIAIKNANPTDTENNRKYFQENYSGPLSAHRPVIIEGDSVSIHKSVATHNEMGFLEGRRFIREEILAVLDVPPAKIGVMETANRSNAREQDKAFREATRALQSLFEDSINETLIYDVLGIRDMKFVHNPSDQQDQVELMEYFTKGEAFGIYSPNEVRARLGYPPTEGGNIPFVQTPTGAIPVALLPEMFRFPTPNTWLDPRIYPDRVSPDAPAEGSGADFQGASTKKTLDYIEKSLVQKSHIFPTYSLSLELGNAEVTRHVRAAMNSLKDDAAYRGYLELAKEAIGEPEL